METDVTMPQTEELIGEVYYAPDEREAIRATLRLTLMVRQRGFTIVACMWLVLLLISVYLLLSGSSVSAYHIMVFLFPLLLAAIWLIRIKSVYRTTQKLQNERKGTQFRFYREHFDKDSARSAVSLRYDQLASIEEGKKCFVLQVIRGMDVLYVPKQGMDAATETFLHEKSRKTHRARSAMITVLVTLAVWAAFMAAYLYFSDGISRRYVVQSEFFAESHMRRTFATTQYCTQAQADGDGTIYFWVNRSQKQEWLKYAESLIEKADQTRNSPGYHGWEMSVSEDRKTLRLYGNEVADEDAFVLWNNTHQLVKEYCLAMQITQIFSGEEDWKIEVIVYDIRDNTEKMRLNLPEDTFDVPLSIFQEET